VLDHSPQRGESIDRRSIGGGIRDSENLVAYRTQLLNTANHHQDTFPSLTRRQPPSAFPKSQSQPTWSAVGAGIPCS